MQMKLFLNMFAGFFLPVPLSHPTLTVVPTLGEIYEGDRLYLICGVQGTPPVTFKWYRVGNENPLHTNTTNSNNTNFQVKDLAKHHSGMYFCEAINPANTVVSSKPVTIEGETVHVVVIPTVL